MDINQESLPKKIVCQVDENDATMTVFLFSYIGDINEGYIWCFSFVIWAMTDSHKQMLKRINGLIIPENDSCYHQLLEKTNILDNLGYNSLMPYHPPNINDLNTGIFKILDDFKLRS